MFLGGIADKLGNRYEAKWLVRQLFDVIGGKADSLRFEGTTTEFDGFEFCVNRGGVSEWHQTKITSSHGNWTPKALQREGVLAAFKRRLSTDSNCICIFVSQHPAKTLESLTERSRISNSTTEFELTLGKELRIEFEQLVSVWGTDAEFAFDWLSRSHFRTESENSIESLNATLSDVYFWNPEAAFEVIRDFAERSINKHLTRSVLSIGLADEGKLQPKHWDQAPSIREKLEAQTAEYLETFSPFGVGGTPISRPQTGEVLRLLEATDGPRVVILTGVAGAGKSGVVRETLAALRSSGVCHLAFRIDHHLSCTTARDLGSAILGRSESVVTTLSGVAGLQPSVLLIDQVDAVSEVSGRNGVLKHAILSMVADARNYGNTRILIVCRTFDLTNDQRLKELKAQSGVAHIEVPLLSWEDQVEPLLRKKEVEVEALSDLQRNLLCLPLNLALFLEVRENGSPPFQSRNDLFELLIDRKDRAIRHSRSVPWAIMAPLSKLADRMSIDQKLTAPINVLSDFASSADLLASENLITKSKTRASFFHESFFDYVFAKSFESRKQSLVELLSSSEQHLFRRTQTRQILETLRQGEPERYLRELREVLGSSHIRMHIRVAIAQWLSSLAEPTRGERLVALKDEDEDAPLGLLARTSVLGSAGWFDCLEETDWLWRGLNSPIESRKEQILHWLTRVAGHRPDKVADLMKRWWEADRSRHHRLLVWIGFVSRQDGDDALGKLCVDLLSAPQSDSLTTSRNHNLDLLFHTWLAPSRSGGGEVLAAYFGAWFLANPGRHPFESDADERMAEYAFAELAKARPEDFLKGAIPALSRSIELIASRISSGQRDHTFGSRNFSGYHHGEDAFLVLVRDALVRVASVNPTLAVDFLRVLDPNLHEVSVHLRLESISANPRHLSYLLPNLLGNPFLLEAGWSGAEWKSFASATKASIPFLSNDELSMVEKYLEEMRPELNYISDAARRLKAGGESSGWHSRSSIVRQLNYTGHVQWCVLEAIGEDSLSAGLQARLNLLRRKFPALRVPEPRHAEASFVGSPIPRERASLMSDANWLTAMKQYDGDQFRMYQDMARGGASQLAHELGHQASLHSSRMARLIGQIPEGTNPTYIDNILFGLAEAENVDSDVLIAALSAAHGRSDCPHGPAICRLISKYQKLAEDHGIFSILAWYLENGNDPPSQGRDTSSSPDKELTTIEELLGLGATVRIRGMNSIRGAAAECMASVLWDAPHLATKCVELLAERIRIEPDIGVRCCLASCLVPLYNFDKELSAKLLDSLAREPQELAARSQPRALLSAWTYLALPEAARSSIASKLMLLAAQPVGHVLRARSRRELLSGLPKWWLPAITHKGFYLLQFVLSNVSSLGKIVLRRLLTSGDEDCEAIGAWHVFRMGFEDTSYVQLGDMLANESVKHRRILASLAANAVSKFENRRRAEMILINSFSDTDEHVRRHAAAVFRDIGPAEFESYFGLAESFVRSRAFGQDAFGFFRALENAECRVDALVVGAAEVLISDLEVNGNVGGRRTMDLHQLRDLMKREYSASEDSPSLRARLLDVIDRMVSMELYGVEDLIAAHDR